MFEEARYSFRLRRLQASQRKSFATHDLRIKTAVEDKSDADTIQRLEWEAQTDSQDFEGTIAQLQTRHLIRMAEKYLLPYPEQEDWAEEQPPFYYRHLTPEASARLRSAIRQEERERFERWARWVPFATGLTGLFGTFIGVIAIIWTFILKL